MRRHLYTTCILLLLFLATQAQDTGMQLYQLPGINFKKPILIGQTTSSYVIMDLPGIDGTPVYFIGADYKLLKKTNFPAGVYSGKYSSANDRIVLLWTDKEQDSLKLNQLKLDQYGEKISSSQKNIPAYKHLISDKKNQHCFFFSVFVDSLQHMIIKGILIDTALNVLNTVAQSLDFDENLDRVCGPILDAAGNVHTVMYDQLSNYRESVNVRINTIPATENSVVTESFQFDKVKFYDMIFFENTADQQVQLAGFYYDGNSKVKKGVASIQFPYARINKVAQRFNLISEQQRIYLATGMKTPRKHSDILDYLKLKDIVEKDGQVVITAWMLDLQNKEIVKDHEYEEYNNVNTANWVRSNIGGWLNNGPKSNLPAPIDAVNPSVPVVLYGEISATQVGVRNYTYAKPVKKTTSKSRTAINSVQAHSRVPQKIVFLSIDKQGVQNWMQLVPGDFPVNSASFSNQLLDYPIIEKEQLYFTHFSPLKTKDGKSNTGFAGGSLINMNELGVTNKPFIAEKMEELIFYKPSRLINGKYLSAYLNPVTQESGLAVLQVAAQ